MLSQAAVLSLSPADSVSVTGRPSGPTLTLQTKGEAIDLKNAVFDDPTSETSASTAAMHSQNPHPPSGSRWEKTDATERPQSVVLCDKPWNVFVIFHRCTFTLYNGCFAKNIMNCNYHFEMIGIKFGENKLYEWHYIWWKCCTCLERSKKFGCIVYILMIHFHVTHVTHVMLISYRVIWLWYFYVIIYGILRNGSICLLRPPHSFVWYWNGF